MGRICGFVIKCDVLFCVWNIFFITEYASLGIGCGVHSHVLSWRSEWCDMAVTILFHVWIFLFTVQCESAPSPSKLFSNKSWWGGESDEFLTNAFSLCTQMAIWFSSFDLLMWWIILIEFLILNSPGRSPFCSWQFSLHTSWVRFAVFCVCVCWSGLEFWFECVLSVTF